VLKILKIRDIDTTFRFMMRSLPSAISSRSMSTLTTTCQKVDGVAATPTEMAGLETPILMSQNGREAYNTWSHT